MSMNHIGLLVLLLVLVVFVGFPVLCLALGVVRLKTHGWRGARLLLGFGTGTVASYLVLLSAYIVWVGPGRSGILTQGRSPEGREYLVVQSFKNMVELYQVSFYVRDEVGTWHWNDLEHEDAAWHSATVTFSNGAAQVRRNGNPFREIALPAKPVDLAQVGPADHNHFCPATFTVDEVVAFHHKANQRSPQSRTPPW